MKHLFRRLLAAFLALACTVTPALASQALGWELERSVTTVGPGVTVTTQTFWGDSKSDYRAEQFVTYTPGQAGVSPVVTYGATVPAKGTLTSMARALEAGGRRVLAGANGDYFVVATGVPLGVVVTDGILRSSASYHYAVGFDANGNAIVGAPEMTVWADIAGMHLAVRGGYNKTRVQEDGLTVFNRDFGTATKGDGEGLNVLLRPVILPEDYTPPVYQPPAHQPPAFTEDMTQEAYDGILAAYEAEYNAALAAYEGEYNAALAASSAALATAPAQLTIGGKVTCVVTGVSSQTGGVAIPESGFILTAGKASNVFYQTTLSNLRVGERVDISATCADERWNTVRQALGGYQLLLKDGVVQDGLDNAANPRTALGVRENGQVLLYTIDGRKSGHSVGASMKQVAARLKELGCVDAVLFDGGGSTTFGATATMDSVFTLQNTPSDGGQRAVTDALFFVSNLQPTGELGSLYITPKSGLFLPGGKVDLTAQGVDSGYYPMAGVVDDVTYSVSGPGSVSGRTFTAGATAEKTEAIVTGTGVDGQQGSTVLSVVPTPHTITVKNEATGQTVTGLNLDPGQTVSLTASATWYGLPLTATDASFTWTATGGVGTVDAVGTFTAGSKVASGAVTVTAGSKTVSIPVSVAGHVIPLADFEGSENPFHAAGGTAGWLTEAQVKYGRQAMAVVCGEPAVQLETDLPLTAGETDLSFWLYPEGTVNVEVLFRLTDGTQTAVPAAAGTPGRWNFVQVPLPEYAAAVSGLRLTAAAGTTVYADHFATTNGGLRDETPPTVELRYSNGNLTAQLSDNMDKTFAQGRMELTLDGNPLPFTLSGSTVTATVGVQDGFLHRVSLTAADASGNLKRASIQIDPAAGTASPFADTQGHWAAPYADYLYAQGVTQGSPSGGSLLYRPGDNITRGDFVTMLCRWMGLDLSQYADVTLPFADTSSIQPWAVDAVKAAYALGIFNGSAAAGDRIYALANQPITRAEAMTLLGRILPKGYAKSAETFLDQSAIPAWAEEHISILVAQGVVNGYAGYVRPQDPITRAEVAKVLTVMW